MDVWAAFLVALFLGLNPAPIFSDPPSPEDVVRAAAIHARSEGILRYEGVVETPENGGAAITALEIDAADLTARAERFFVSSAADAGVATFRIAAQDLAIAPVATGAAAMLRDFGLEQLAGDAWFDIEYDAASSSVSIRVDVDLHAFGRAVATLRFTDLRYVRTAGWSFDLYDQLVSEADAVDPASALLGAMMARLSSHLVRPFPALRASHSAAAPGGADGAVAEFSVEVEDLGGVAEARDALTRGDPSDVARRAAAERLVGLAAEGLLMRAAPEARAAAGVAAAKAAVAENLDAFLAEPGGARWSIAPSTPIQLSEIASALQDADAMNRLFYQLRSAVEGDAPATQPISSTTLKAATVDGYGVRPIAALALAEALLTGVGAPRSLDRALDLARGPAEAGDPEALRIVAEALRQRGDAPEDAYETAIRAAALGARTAALADEIEADLRLEAILDAQRAASAAPVAEEIAWLVEDARSGAPAAMRRLAQRYHRGRGATRNLSEAFFWASLAAAAGDDVGLRLRDRLARRFDHSAPDAQELWRETMRDAEARALQTWIRDGLGDRLAGE